MTRARLAAAAGLLIYAGLVALLAAHYRFPYRPAALVAVQQVETSVPVRLSFNGPYPGRPFRSSLDQVDVGLVSPQGILPLILFEKVDLKPRLFSLPARRRLALDYAAETNKGYVLGYMAWRPLAKDSLCFEIREMDLPDFTLPGLPGQGRISGRLTGTLIVEGQEQAMPSGGRGLFKIGPGRISGLSLPQVPAGDLDFKLLTLEFDLDPQGMNFTKISLDGGQTGVELTGRVDNYQNPWLNLTGTARLGPADQPMFSAPIQITGPATQPRVNVSLPGGMLPPVE